MKHTAIKQLPSARSSSRRDQAVSAVVLYCTGELAHTLDRFTAPGGKLSCHFIVPRHEEEPIVQMVDVARKAWHAGRARLHQEDHVNLFSVGVQLVGTRESGYTDHQYDAAAQICADLMDRFPLLVANRIVGHDSISEKGKKDNGPGPLWRWDVFFDVLSRRLYGLDIERL